MPRLIPLMVMLLAVAAIGLATVRSAVSRPSAAIERKLEPRFALHLDMRDVPGRLRGPALDAVQDTVVARLRTLTPTFSIEVPGPDLLVISVAERGSVLGSIMRTLASADEFPVPVQVTVWENEP